MFNIRTIPFTFLFNIWLLEMFFGFALPDRALGQWVQTDGPGGGSPQVNTLCSGGSAIYAEVSSYSSQKGTGRVYCTTNAGDNWGMVDDGIPPDSVTILSADSQIVLAGTNDGRVFLSTNQGTVWTLLNNGIPNTVVNVILVDSAGVFVGTNNGLFKTTNNGVNWNSVGTGLADSMITSLASEGNFIYAGTDSGLFVSKDGGLSWNRIDKGPVDPRIYSIALVTNEIFVSGDNGEVFRSSDGGLSWVETDSGLYAYGGAGKLTALNDTTIFTVSGESYPMRSSNNGRNWSTIPGLLFKGNINLFSAENNNIYAGTQQDGVWRSTDNGANWVPVNNGFVTGSVGEMATSNNNIDAIDNRTGDFFTSSDQGTTWTQTDSVFQGPNSLLSNGVYDFVVAQGIFRSSDNGIHWTLQDSARKMYTTGGLISIGSNIFAATNAGISVSNDNGVSWHVADSGMFSQNVVVNTGDTYPPIVCSLATDGANIFAGTYGSGIFKSTNLGQSWFPINNGLPSAIDTMVTALVTSGQNIFACVNFYAIYLSTDGGINWNQVNNGMGEYASVKSFVTVDTLVFAGTDIGVFIFKRSNKSWVSVNDGLLDMQVNSMVAENSVLYVGTAGSGVWKRPISEMVIDGVHEIKPEVLSKFNLYQNYPNPFNPSTVISYQLPEISYVTLKVYDVLGREVRTLVNEKKNAGTHIVTFDGSNLASGVYFYKLSTPEYSKVQKMILMK